MSLLIASAGDPGELLLADVSDGAFRIDARVSLPHPPQAMVAHPRTPVAYAASWMPDGEVIAIDFAPPAPHRIGPPQRTGAHTPCSLAVDSSGRTLCVADYDGGITTFALDRSGAIIRRTGSLTVPGSGPDAERQSGSHPHHVHFEAEDSHVVMIDLGADRVYTLPFDARTRRVQAPAIDSGHAPTGAGPRTAAPIGDGRLVVTHELDATVGLYGRTDHGYRVLGTDAVSLRTGDRDYPSDVVVSADGAFAFVADRVADTIVVFRIGSRLERVAQVDSGAWPMSLAIVGDALYCASRDDDAVRSWRVDAASGALTKGGTLRVASPVSVESVRWA